MNDINILGDSKEELVKEQNQTKQKKKSKKINSKTSNEISKKSI